jgi:hypothetical protein
LAGSGKSAYFVLAGFGRFSSQRVKKTFQANTDDIGYVTTTFDRDIKAQFIRIHPKTWSPANNILGMRAEVLGRRKGKNQKMVIKFIEQFTLSFMV